MKSRLCYIFLSRPANQYIGFKNAEEIDQNVRPTAFVDARGI